MKASELIGELVRSIVQDGDRDVMISVHGARREIPEHGGIYPVGSVRTAGMTIFLRDPEPEVEYRPHLGAQNQIAMLAEERVPIVPGGSGD